MKNKADDKEHLITLAKKEIIEWIKVRRKAELEIEKWKQFIDKLKKEK